MPISRSMPQHFRLTVASDVYIRIILTHRCNNSCSYCFREADKPEDGNLFEPLFFQELARVADRHAISKIHFTGGEPLMDPSVVSYILDITRKSCVSVGLTTNGRLLHLYADRLFNSGLLGINISLPTLQPERYRKICGSNGLKTVLLNIDLALKIGFSPIKINVPLFSGNFDEITDFMEYFLPKEGIDLRFFSILPNDGVKEWDTLDPNQVICHLDNSIERLESWLRKEALTRVYFRPPGRPSFKVCRDCGYKEFCLDQAKAIRIWKNGDVRLCLHNPDYTQRIEHPSEISAVVSEMKELCK